MVKIFILIGHISKIIYIYIQFQKDISISYKNSPHSYSLINTLYRALNLIEKRDHEARINGRSRESREPAYQNKLQYISNRTFVQARESTRQKSTQKTLCHAVLAADDRPKIKRNI